LEKATAIASKLHLDVCVVNPVQRGWVFFSSLISLDESLTAHRMDDAKLSKLFRDCPAKSIILIEDMYVLFSPPHIDRIFPRNRFGGRIPNQDSIDEADSKLKVPDEAQAEQASPTLMVGDSHNLAPSTVTLSGLLNAIDGVSSQVTCSPF
jgi:chaperone BCS1